MSPVSELGPPRQPCVEFRPARSWQHHLQRPDRNLIAELCELAVEQEPSLFYAVGYCLWYYLNPDHFQEAVEADDWPGNRIPGHVPEEAVRECTSLLEQIYGRMSDRERAGHLRGAAWEHIFVAALRILCGHASTQVHHDCEVWVDEVQIRTENRWSTAGERSSVTSLDAAEWDQDSASEVGCKICSCKVAPDKFYEVDIAYVRDVWERTGRHARVCLVSAVWYPNFKKVFRERRQSLVTFPSDARFVTAESICKMLTTLRSR